MFSFKTVALFLTKHPNIAGGGEPPEVDALGGHPLDRQLSLASLQKVIGQTSEILFDLI